MTSGINVMNVWKLIVRVWKDKKTEKDSVFVIFTENIVHAICHTTKGLLDHTEIHIHQLTVEAASQ